MEKKSSITLSVIVPVYNEEGNVASLFDELSASLSSAGREYEVIFVDDGSSDGSAERIAEKIRGLRAFKLIRLRRNSGQTAALAAGFDHAAGEVIIPIDGDLENDPADIPTLLEKLEEGYDVVSGWRKNRWEGQWFSRKLPSAAANRLISRITGVRLADYGCTLKAYRKEAMHGVSLYGEMHRFIPAYAHWSGARVCEIEVNHRPRKHGRSKYGFSRTFKVLLDLVVVKFLDRYMTKPMHFFGGVGFASLFLGGVAGIAAIALKIFGIRDFVATPLPVFSALFIIVGVQLIIMGVLAEMVMRTYYESQGKKSYGIKEKHNFD